MEGTPAATALSVASVRVVRVILVRDLFEVSRLDAGQVCRRARVVYAAIFSDREGFSWSPQRIWDAFVVDCFAASSWGRGRDDEVADCDALEMSKLAVLQYVSCEQYNSVFRQLYIPMRAAIASARGQHQLARRCHCP